MVCKSRKEAMRRFLLMKEKMGWTDNNTPQPIPEKQPEKKK